MKAGVGTTAAGWVALGVTVLSVGSADVEAQSLEQRLEGFDGVVSFYFDGREGVEGCGDRNISLGRQRWNWGSSDRRRGDCGPGPVLVEMDVVDGRARHLETRVGPHVAEEPGRDLELGRVEPQDAADFLLSVAQTGSASVAEDAVFPSFLARDVVVWPRLIALARDRSRPEEVRSQALFWVGQEAGGVAIDGLGDVARDESEDHEIREAAVFALSQRPAGEGVPILMEVARNAEDMETRRSAMFWLAQSDDPEVVDFFEEVLGGRQ